MARRWLSAALVLLAAAVVTPTGSAETPSYYRIEDGVRIGREMRPIIARIARKFHGRTGRGIVITSGTRNAREQAGAMYGKLILGQRLTSVYLDYDAAAEIQAAYDEHRRRGRRPCVDAMARVIERQVARGRFISRHLRESAVDVRSRDMTRREQRIFEQVVARFERVSLLYEGSPPHFHLQLD